MTTPDKNLGPDPRGSASSPSSDPDREIESAANLRVPRQFRAAFGEALTRAERSVGAEDPASATESKRTLATLRDVQTSFRAHAEVLDSILDTQRRLLGAIGRADRSEMMVASTQALNETFKSLQETQRELCARLASPDGGRGGWGKGSRAGTLLLAGLLFALASAGLVGSALLLRDRGADSSAVDERVGLIEDKLSSTADVSAAASSLGDLASALRDATERMTETLAQNGSLSHQLDEERTVGADLLEKTKRFEREVTDLNQSIAAANTTSDGFRAKYLEAEERAARLATELEELRRLPSVLTNSSAEATITPPAAAESAPAPSAEPAPGAATAGTETAPANDAIPTTAGDAPTAPAEPHAITDPSILGPYRDSLNRLLAMRSGTDRYELDEIRDVADGAARGVKLRKVSGEGTVKSYEAERLRAYLDEKNHWVEFRLEDGRLHYAGRSIPFLNGRFSFMVMEVDVAEWKRAALPFLGAGDDSRRSPAVAAPPVDAGPPPVGSRKQSP